jgi:hypothetical protein
MLLFVFSGLYGWVVGWFNVLWCGELPTQLTLPYAGTALYSAHLGLPTSLYL